MGKSTTPRYVVQMVEPGTYTTPFAWHVRAQYGARGYGKPTDANLEKFVMASVKSMEPGGVNAHIPRGLGFIPYPTKATIRDQFTGEIVAQWEAAPFQAWG